MVWYTFLGLLLTQKLPFHLTRLLSSRFRRPLLFDSGGNFCCSAIQPNASRWCQMIGSKVLLVLYWPKNWILIEKLYDLHPRRRSHVHWIMLLGERWIIGYYYRPLLYVDMPPKKMSEKTCEEPVGAPAWKTFFRGMNKLSETMTNRERTRAVRGL